MKAARRAKSGNRTSSIKEMNKSFGALESKKRQQQRKQRELHGSLRGAAAFPSSLPGDKSSSSTASNLPTNKKTIPTRAKSMGNPISTMQRSSDNPVKSAVSKLAGSTEYCNDSKTAAESGSAVKAAIGKKHGGSTLAALKSLSAAVDGAGGGGGGEKSNGKKGDNDLKNAIMQQVYRNASLDPMQLKIKAKPKMKKSMSLSGAGMVAKLSISDEKFEGKEVPARIRRSRTSSDRAQASISGLNNSYHASMAKMRQQKQQQQQKTISDASDKSSQSLSKSAHSATSSQASVEASAVSSSGSRPHNVDRKSKSFSHPVRPKNNILAKDNTNNEDTIIEEEEETTSPEQRSSTAAAIRPRLRRGSSKRFSQSPGSKSPGSKSPGSRSPVGSSGMRSSGLTKSSSKRGMQKTGSRRKLVLEYDATPQVPKGQNVISLLKCQESVTNQHLMQKGNRQMFHALLFKTRMNTDMEKLQRKVDGLDVSEEEEEEASADEESEESEED